MCTFTPSTTLMRGPRLALSKAGLFHVSAKGAFSTYKRRLAFTELGLRPIITRASGVVDGGIVRAAFLFAQNVNYTHHVHPQTLRAGNPGPCRKANYPRPQPGTRPANPCRPDRATPRIFGQSQAHCQEVEPGAANARQAVKQADYLPLFSTYFLNLQQVNTL